MAEIRTQLSAVTDPLRVTVAQQISVAHRAENLSALQGVSREQRKPKVRSVEEALDEVEQAGAQVDASALVMNSVRATGTMPATPPSSLSKDAERRRDETPVSVTIRSV